MTTTGHWSPEDSGREEEEEKRRKTTTPTAAVEAGALIYLDIDHGMEDGHGI